ncbi:protein kinase [Schistosoma mansoni]|uniref:protein kinase n=1 Tax=Schistosoma mansoni TaxID=6183 RepID=UPI00022DC8A7|nr:protein kinase [Schistosoma mansoni]|eukprot:XP_018649569.1 protein kinase [Schistosoma mansoni]
MSVRSELSEQKLGYIREFVNNKDPKEEYKLIQSIGTGTYGEVYKAIRLRTKEFAAVKIIKVDAKDDVRAILQEIQTLRECRHCNIVQFFGSYFRNNKLWICMEFCGGFSMQDIYTNIQRPIEENCIAFVSRETLRGIEYMHKAGKIHRDIKGANILLTTDADFGVAAQITQTIQRRNSFIGTPYWMAPEVAAVERKGGYDEKCDVWALGITAIEYAELQPPLFDLHPMRALRILGMRSYKPPVLRNKSLWSQKFHNFLKASLTKSEKKRPTAQALLRHEFVNQPHLTRLLTLKLLETNRNPNITNNRLSIHGNNNNHSTNQQQQQQTKITHIKKEEQLPEEYSALLVGRPDYPMIINNKLSIQHSNEQYKDRTLVRSQNVPQTSVDNQSSSSSTIISSSDIKRPVSSTPSNRPEPLIKMHTPWQSQQIKSDQSSPINLSKPTTTIAEVIVQKSSIITPMERIQSARPQQFLIEHSIINDGNALNNKLNIDKTNSHHHHHPSTSKSILEEIRIMDELPTPFPAYVASAPTATPALKPPGLNYQLNNSTSKHAENIIQKTTISSYSPGVSQLLHTQTTTNYDLSSTTVTVSHKNHQHLQQQQHRRSSSNNSSSISSASTSPRSSCSSSQLDLLDPVSTDLTSGSHQTTILSSSDSSSPTSRGSVTSSSSSSTSSSVSAEAAVGDDDLNENDDANILISAANVEHKSDFLGVDDDAEEVFLNEDKDLKSVDKQQDEKDTENYNHQEYLAITEHTIIQDSLEARFLPIDSEESLSDRISEFGFRIHGSSEGEEDLEDEDDDPDDTGIRDEIIIPNDLSNINMMNLCQLPSNTNNGEGISPTLSRMNNMNTNGNTNDIPSTQKVSLSTMEGTNPNIQMTNGNQNGDHMDLLNKSTKLNSTMINTTTNNNVNNHNNRLISQKELDLNDIVNSTGHEFYPEKSGEELMSLLRQLKFAQKFAWLSGASVLPTGLSALTNIQSNKLTNNNNDDLNHNGQSLTNGIINEKYTNIDTLNVMKISSTIKTIKQDQIDDDQKELMKLDVTMDSTIVTTSHDHDHEDEDDQDKKLNNQGITLLKHNHLEDYSIVLNGDDSTLNKINGKLNDTQNDGNIDDSITNDIIDHSFIKQEQNGHVFNTTDIIINGQINNGFDGDSELPLFMKDKSRSDSDSSMKSEMKINLDTISTTYKPDNISLSTKPTIDIPTPVPTTTICSINNKSDIQPHSPVVNNIPSTPTITTDNHRTIMMMNTKDYVQVSSSLPSTPVSSSFVPANFNVIPTIDDNNNNNDRMKSESHFQMTKLSLSEKQDIASVKNYTSLPSSTITTYPSDVVITTKCTTTTGTHTTYPISSSSSITTTTSPTIGLSTKPTPISISNDIHPIDSDDIEVDDIVYSNLSNQGKSHIGGSLQLIPQRKEKNTNRKKLFYRSSLSPCSDIHPFPSSTSLVTTSLPKRNDQEICTNDYQKIVSGVIPPSTLTSPITDTEIMRTTASTSYLLSNQPLALQPHLKMVSSIELSSNLNGNNINNRSHNDNFSKDLPLVSSVKLHRRVAAPTVTSSVFTNSATIATTHATTMSKIATSPALISSVVNPVNTNETKKSRSSMIELISCPNKDASHPGQILSSIPPPLASLTSPTPQSKPRGNMGACFSLVFQGCPLKINSTATWINPANNGQVILLGTNDGIYCLQLKGLSENSLELLFPRRCLWLSVTRDTMMSLSGRHPQLYAHNLVSLMKLKSQGHSMSGGGSTVGGSGGGSGGNVSGLGGAASKFGKFVKLFPKRFSPSKKMPDTKGCLRANVTRNPFNGAKYLCAAMTNEILVMEWFNPVSSFIEIKRVC